VNFLAVTQFPQIGVFLIGLAVGIFVYVYLFFGKDE